MKCHAEKKLAVDRLNDAYKTVGKTIIAYLDASAGCVINELRGHSKKRLQAMYDITKNTLDGMIDFYGDNNDDTRDRTETSLYAMMRELQECGFNFAEVTQQFPVDDPFLKLWHPERERGKHKRRLDFINDMELIAQTYHITILTYFRREHRYGSLRLYSLYQALREDYNLMLAEYLRCTSAGDMKIQTMIEERQNRLEKIGLTLVEV